MTASESVANSGSERSRYGTSAVLVTAPSWSLAAGPSLAEGDERVGNRGGLGLSLGGRLRTGLEGVHRLPQLACELGVDRPLGAAGGDQLLGALGQTAQMVLADDQGGALEAVDLHPELLDRLRIRLGPLRELLQRPLHRRHA